MINQQHITVMAIIFRKLFFPFHWHNFIILSHSTENMIFFLKLHLQLLHLKIIHIFLIIMICHFLKFVLIDLKCLNSMVECNVLVLIPIHDFHPVFFLFLILRVITSFCFFNILSTFFKSLLVFFALDLKFLFTSILLSSLSIL